MQKPKVFMDMSKQLAFEALLALRFSKFEALSLVTQKLEIELLTTKRNYRQNDNSYKEYYPADSSSIFTYSDNSTSFTPTWTINSSSM